MDVRLETPDLRHDMPLLALPGFEGEEALEGTAAKVDARTGGRLSRARESGDFRGEEEDSVLVYGEEAGPSRVLLLGVGKRSELDAEAVRRYAARAVRAAEKRRLGSLTIHLEEAGPVETVELVAAAAEGAVLAGWSFRELKGEDAENGAEGSVEEVVISVPGEAPDLREAVRRGVAVARGENLARTLQARPGNVATPTHLASEAERIASETGMALTVLGPAELEEDGFGALLAVSRGSTEEPRLIALEHRGGEEGAPPLALVGKGLTFDAGGISIKPSKGMEEMKYDMSGGAAVLGAMQAIAELDLPLNVVGVVPSSENLPSGSALKPGDVVRTREGKTVEVVNTDAEGRLILSDALSWTRSTYRPAAIVDCATLTGAVVVGLGHHAIGLMGTDDALVAELRGAGERSGERCWPLPLWEEYRKQLESDFADLKNVGGRPAGAITAGCFLREFVGETPWGHLDVAGTAYGEQPRPYQRKGAYGIPTRLLVEWVRSRALSRESGS